MRIGLKAHEDKVGAIVTTIMTPELGKVYGALYNWYVASSPKIAPEGWQLPPKENGETYQFILQYST
jgi:hypothetical protein